MAGKNKRGQSTGWHKKGGKVNKGKDHLSDDTIVAIEGAMVDREAGIGELKIKFPQSMRHLKKCPQCRLVLADLIHITEQELHNML